MTIKPFNIFVTISFRLYSTAEHPATITIFRCYWGPLATQRTGARNTASLPPLNTYIHTLVSKLFSLYIRTYEYIQLSFFKGSIFLKIITHIHTRLIN